MQWYRRVERCDPPILLCPSSHFCQHCFLKITSHPPFFSVCRNVQIFLHENGFNRKRVEESAIHRHTRSKIIDELAHVKCYFHFPCTNPMIRVQRNVSEFLKIFKVLQGQLSNMILNFCQYEYLENSCDSAQPRPAQYCTRR